MFGGARTPDWPHRHHTPLPGIASSGLRWNKEGTLWSRQPFCPHFSSATEAWGWCDYTLPLFRIPGLGVILAARCLPSRPAWIVFFFLHAGLLMANVGWGGGEVLHWVLGGGGYGPPLPLPHYLHLATHCQSNKSGHLVPSVCSFQHNRDQTVRCKRLFVHLL